MFVKKQLPREYLPFSGKVHGPTVVALNPRTTAAVLWSRGIGEGVVLTMQQGGDKRSLGDFTRGYWQGVSARQLGVIEELAITHEVRGFCASLLALEDLSFKSFLNLELKGVPLS